MSSIVDPMKISFLILKASPLTNTTWVLFPHTLVNNKGITLFSNRDYIIKWASQHTRPCPQKRGVFRASATRELSSCSVPIIRGRRGHSTKTTAAPGLPGELLTGNSNEYKMSKESSNRRPCLIVQYRRTN